MNLVTYLVGDLHLDSATSATIVTNFMGTLNLLGLLGGFLADAKLGRYVTVVIFATIAAMVNFSIFDYIIINNCIILLFGFISTPFSHIKRNFTVISN